MDVDAWHTMGAGERGGKEKGERGEGEGREKRGRVEVEGREMGGQRVG
mgnify:CR=1 FL=1